MAHRERDQAVVPDDIERQLQLLAPEAAIANKRSLCTLLATLALIQGIVKMPEILEARIKHALIRTIAWVRVVEQWHVA
jgi:hypothetical protein